LQVELKDLYGRDRDLLRNTGLSLIRSKRSLNEDRVIQKEETNLSSVIVLICLIVCF